MNLPVNGPILLLGEGDFSFSVAFRRKLPSSSLFATCLLTERELYNSHQSAKENVNKLQDSGVEIRFEVDATQLAQNQHIGKRKFRRVIFNFPHTGGKSNIKNNRKLLKDFFNSVGSVLEPGGDVCVTLCQGQGGTPLDQPIREWHDSWQVVTMAAFSDFVPVDIQPFKSTDYEEYSSTGFRSLDRHFYTEGSMTHVFHYVQSPVVTPEAQSLRGGIITDSNKGTFQTLRYLADKYGKNHIANREHPIGLVTEQLKDSLQRHGGELDIVKDTSAVISKPLRETASVCVYDLKVVDGPQSADDSHQPADDSHQPADDSHQPADDSHQPADDSHQPADDSHRLRTTMLETLYAACVERQHVVDDQPNEGDRSLDSLLLSAGDVFRRPSSYNHLDLPVQHEMVGILNTDDSDPVSRLKGMVTSCVSEVIDDSRTRVCVTRTTDLPAVYQAHFEAGDMFSVELVFDSLNEFYCNACNQVVERGKPDAMRKLAKISKVSREIGYIGKPRHELDDSHQSQSNSCMFVIILDQLAMIKYDIPDARLLWSNRITTQFSTDPVCFRTLNYFPPLWRHDLSFWDSDTEEFEEGRLHDVIREVAGDMLKCVLLQSVWPDPSTGRISRCYRQVHQSPDLSISHSKAHHAQNAIRLTVAKELGVTLR